MGTCGVEEMRMEAAMAAFEPQCHPRKRPTVGAGSSQREDSPAHRLPATLRAYHARPSHGNTLDGYGGVGGFEGDECAMRH